MKTIAKSPAEQLAPGRAVTLANVAEGAEGFNALLHQSGDGLDVVGLPLLHLLLGLDGAPQILDGLSGMGSVRTLLLIGAPTDKAMVASAEVRKPSLERTVIGSSPW